jgi:hypothetical protein
MRRALLFLGVLSLLAVSVTPVEAWRNGYNSCGCFLRRGGNRERVSFRYRGSGNGSGNYQMTSPYPEDQGQGYCPSCNQGNVGWPPQAQAFDSASQLPNYGYVPSQPIYEPRDRINNGLPVSPIWINNDLPSPPPRVDNSLPSGPVYINNDLPSQLPAYIDRGERDWRRAIFINNRIGDRRDRGDIDAREAWWYRNRDSGNLDPGEAAWLRNRDDRDLARWYAIADRDRNFGDRGSNCDSFGLPVPDFRDRIDGLEGRLRDLELRRGQDPDLDRRLLALERDRELNRNGFVAIMRDRDGREIRRTRFGSACPLCITLSPELGR